MRQLPARPNLEHLKSQAKALLSDWKSGAPEALQRVRALRFENETPALNKAQLVLAREYGFESWTALKEVVESVPESRKEAAKALIAVSLSERPEPTKRKAIEGILERHSDLADFDLSLACTMGNADFVRKALQANPAAANKPTGERAWPPLLYACFSWFLQNEASCRPGIREVVRLLLGAGADPNASYKHGDWPLSALYGAVGYARDLETARMLLEAGANPNDGECCYHAAERPGHEFYELLFAKGVDEANQSHAIFRKLDFDDLDTVRWLLDHGVSANARWSADQATPLMHALNRDRSLPFFELLLERGADPNLVDDAGQSPYRLASLLGRTDVMRLLGAHGADTTLGAFEAWASKVIDGKEPGPAPDFGKLGRSQKDLLCRLAGEGKANEVARLLDAGFPIELGLWSTPLHAACWNGQLDVVKLLIDRGAPLEVRDPVYNAFPTGWTMHGSVWCKKAPPEVYVAVMEALVQAGASLPLQEETSWQDEGSASEEVREWLLATNGNRQTKGDR